jgi:hypothetical protein
MNEQIEGTLVWVTQTPTKKGIYYTIWHWFDVVVLTEEEKEKLLLQGWREVEGLHVGIWHLMYHDYPVGYV